MLEPRYESYLGIGSAQQSQVAGRVLRLDLRANILFVQDDRNGLPNASRRGTAQQRGQWGHVGANSTSAHNVSDTTL